MSASLVVVHSAGLAAGAPDPRDRQMLRRVLSLGAVTNVTLVCAEPQLGPRAYPELAAGGVAVIEAVAGIEEWLRDARTATAVLATSVELGQVVQRARPDLTLVLDLATIASLDFDYEGVDVDPREQPGRTTMRDHLRARDRAVLEHATLVIATSPRLARDIATIAPGAHTVTVEPPVPLSAARTAPRTRRVGLVGSFTSERGLPAEAALVVLAEHAAGSEVEVLAVGVDASVVRRAVASTVLVSPVCDMATVSRSLRAAITVHRDDPVSAELRGLGVPLVLHDPDDPTSASRASLPLVADDDVWRRAHLRVLTDAAARHDPDHCAAALLGALRDVGVLPMTPTRLGPNVEALPTWERRSVAGSLAAQTSVTEQLRHECQPDAIVPWQHALYTNLDLAPDVAYRRWLDVHHDGAPRRAVFTARADRLVDPPLLSVVMPVHDTDPTVLRAAIASVRAQIYTNWQLCIADDGSTRAATRAVLDNEIASDSRIDVVRTDTSGGISAATNRALVIAHGSYVAFCDHDDVLTEDALAWVARAIDLDPSVDIVYSDEDKLDEQGLRVEPFCKPDWSPDLLLSCNYITHLLVVRRTLLARVGGLRSAFDGAQDYDLLLRLTEHTDRVAHIAKPLYSWRKSAASTAANIHAKPLAHSSSRRALDEALVRRGLDEAREPGIDPTWHRVRHPIGQRPSVTVIIPTRDRVDLLEPCVDLLRRSVAHRPLEILVVDNDSTDPATLCYLDAFDGRVVRYPHRFNYARQMNLAALEANGEILLLLNNDARPVGGGWFDALLEHALRPEVGAVGARLRFPDGSAQHEGVVLNAGGVALNLDAGSYAVLADNVRDVAAVTGACMMLRRGVWHAVAGMDERLRVAYNDVDLCLRIGERGWRNIYTPLAELTHAESSSRGSLHPEVDEAFYQQRWGPPRTCADPFFTTSIELLQPFSPRL